MILFTKCLSAQTFMEKDSLLSLLTSKKDTSLVLLYYDIGLQYENNKVDSAKYYYIEARKLSKKLDFTIGELKFISNYTAILNSQGNLDSSLILNKQAILIAEKINDKKQLAIAYGNLGASYQFLGNYDSAVIKYIISEKYLEAIGNKKYQSIASANIASIYDNLGNYEQGIFYANKAEKIARDLQDDYCIAAAMINKSNSLINLRRYNEAEKVLLEAIKISRAIKNDAYYLNCLINISDLKIKTEDFDNIKNYMDEALAISKRLNDVMGHNNALRGMATYYLYKKDYVKANRYALQALNEATENKNKDYQLKSIQSLTEIALSNQDFKLAKRYQLQEDSINGLISLETMATKIEETKIKYETEKKETQLKLQQTSIKQKNTLNILFGSSAAAILLVSLFSYKNYRNKQKLQQQKITELETQQQLSATEAVLKGEEQERTRLAKDLHDGLGGMLSGIKYSFNSMKGNLVMTPDNAQAFERSMDMLDSSIKEMRRVAHNMMPEALVKFGLDTALKDFCNDIEKSGALQIAYQSIGLENVVIDQTASITIYRIVQELINNTMKHAVAKNAVVQVTKIDKQLSITVEDDGKGFDKAILKQQAGMGWSNITNRVDFLKGKIDVDSQSGKGTSVHIEIEI
jgi:two-component system, NarL family, sensor kinase